MKHEFVDKPDFGMVLITFEAAGESLTVESGAMVARDDAVEMTTKMKGGLLSAAKRKVLGGESLFLNTFTASAAGQRLYLAPSPEGDLEQMTLNDEEYILQSGSFMAASPTLTLDTKWAGFKGFFSGEGLFFLKVFGSGELFLNSYGGIHKIELDGVRPYTLDTSHIVAFTSGLDFNIRKIGNMKSLFFSGEGLVCEFQGKGTLWAQTRNPGALAGFLHRFRRVERNTN